MVKNGMTFQDTQAELRKRLDQLLGVCSQDSILDISSHLEEEISAKGEIPPYLVSALYFHLGRDSYKDEQVLARYRKEHYPDAPGLYAFEVAKLLVCRGHNFDLILQEMGIPYTTPELKKKIFLEALTQNQRVELWLQHYAPGAPEHLVDDLAFFGYLGLLDWFAKAWKNKEKRACLLREREGGAYITHLVELRMEDLCPSVNRTFDNWRNRTQYQEDPDAPLYRVPADVPEVLQYGKLQAKLLNTYNELKQEGEEMNHCVATYVHGVKAGESYIYSVSYGDERVTCEVGLIEEGGETLYRIEQFKGPSNTEASPSSYGDFVCALTSFVTSEVRSADVLDS